MTHRQNRLLTVSFLAFGLLPHTPGRADFSTREIIFNSPPNPTVTATSSSGKIVALQADTPELLFDLGAKTPLAQPLLALNCRRLPEVCESVRLGFFKEAALALEKLRPETEAMLALVNVQIMMGQDETARRELEHLSSQTQYMPQRTALAGIIHLKAGRLRLAEQQFQIIRQKPGLEALARCAQGHIRLIEGRFDEALSLYREADRLEGRLSYRFNQAATHLLSGHPQPAIGVLQQTLADSPRFSEAYLLLGLAELSQGRPENAAAALLRAEELGAQHAALHYALGVSCQAANLHQLAAQYLEKALAASPGNEELRDQLVVSLLHAGHKNRAARVLTESPVLLGEDPLGHFFLGLKLLLCEQPRAATQVLFRAVALGKRDADTFFALGQALLLDEQVQESLLALQLAVRMAPRRPEIRFMLALALAQDNQIDEALGQLRQAGLEGTGDRDTLQLRMELSHQNGDLQGCITDARMLLQINPELLEARFHLALCLAESGELDDAVRQVKLAVESDREGEATGRALRLLQHLTEERAVVAGWYLLQAQIHQHRGDWSEAVLSLEKFLLLAPTPRWTRLAAGWLHELTSGRRRP